MKMMCKIKQDVKLINIYKSWDSHMTDNIPVGSIIITIQHLYYHVMLSCHLLILR